MRGRPGAPLGLVGVSGGRGVGDQEGGARVGQEKPRALAKKDILRHDQFLSHGCPFSTAPLSEAECRQVQPLFGGHLNDPFVVRNNEDPQGCFSFRGAFYFNDRAYGGGLRQGRTLYCRRIFRQRYVKLTDGTCSRYGFAPIGVKEHCRAAALELGLTNSEVQATDEANRTEGCYFLHNFEDETASLWLGTNPQNKGIGAQETDMLQRQPICVKQDPPGKDVKDTPSKSVQALSDAPESDPLAAHAALHIDLPGHIVSIEGPTNRCPIGTEALTEEDCRALPVSLHGKLHDPFRISSADDPKGCFLFWQWYYFNTHDTGQGREGRTILCKRLDTLSLHALRETKGAPLSTGGSASVV